MDIMYVRKTGKRYEVYGYDPLTKQAICYDPSQASTNGGNGWTRVLMKTLIPEAYVNKANFSFQSKTERNEVKRHLKLVAATWQAEDGTQFDHEHIEDAIEYQRQLMKANTEATDEGH